MRDLLIRLSVTVRHYGVVFMHRIVYSGPWMVYRVAEQLYTHGKESAAKRLFRYLADRMETDRYQLIHRYQLFQFFVYRRLHVLGDNRVDDPLFDCTLRPAEEHPGEHLVIGAFDVCIRVRGLMIDGHLDKTYVSEVRDTGKNVAYLNVYVNETKIRRLSVKLRDGGSQFRFPVRRTALQSFPKDAEIVVSDDSRRRLEFRGCGAARIAVPHADNGISGAGGAWILDKKGYPPTEAVDTALVQERLLELYVGYRDLFDEVVGRPLILTFGTLLGMYRDGAFIPNDDDFDVGYISQYTDPLDVKREAMEIGEKLVRAGGNVLLNRRGKPFRLQSADLSHHLDCCPIWYQNSAMWAPPYGHMNLGMEAMEPIQQASFHGVNVYIPAHPAEFLRSYYGPHWETPDPAYTISALKLPKNVEVNLNSINFRPWDALALRNALAGTEGTFYARAIHSLYPLEEYEKHCG